MSFSRYTIQSLWSGDSSTPSDIAGRVEQMLAAMSPLHPAMDNWLLLDRVREEGIPLAEARSEWTPFIERNVWKDDWDQPAPQNGYLTVIQGAKELTQLGNSDTVHVTLTAGSKFRNGADFEVGRLDLPTSDEITTYPIYKGVLRALAMAWPCPWVLASFQSFDARRPPKKPSPFNLPWIAYLSAPLADGLKVPVDLVAEPTPGGGLIISAVETRIDETNRDHGRRSSLLERILAERVGHDSLLPRPALHPARQGPY